MIDIDRRWKQWGDRDLMKCSLGAINRELDRQIRADGYISAAQQRGIRFSAAQIGEIAQRELIARARYGDAPAHFSGIESGTMKKISVHQPGIMIYREGQPVIEDHFWSPITVGRQSAGESLPFSWVENHGVPKLVCCEGRQSLVSRRQFGIHIVNARFAIIENLSSNRHFLIQDEICVAPQEQRAVALPLTVDLDVIHLAVCRR